jgi:hypothetical protein
MVAIAVAAIAAFAAIGSAAIAAYGLIATRDGNRATNRIEVLVNGRLDSALETIATLSTELAAVKAGPIVVHAIPPVATD